MERIYFIYSVMDEWVYIEVYYLVILKYWGEKDFLGFQKLKKKKLYKMGSWKFSDF